MPKIEQVSQRIYVVEVAGGLEKILYKNIIFISKDGKYVIIHHKNGEVRERKSLSQMMDSLNAQEFVYIDKGYIVNIQQIESLRKDYVVLVFCRDLRWFRHITGISGNCKDKSSIAFQ